MHVFREREREMLTHIFQIPFDERNTTKITRDVEGSRTINIRLFCVCALLNLRMCEAKIKQKKRTCVCVCVCSVLTLSMRNLAQSQPRRPHVAALWRGVAFSVITPQTKQTNTKNVSKAMRKVSERMRTRERISH
jgi:hypothetical protein